MAEHFKITSLVTLETRDVPLDELSRNLLLNSVVQDAHGLEPIGIITHHDLVFFARTWAGEVLDAAGEKLPAAVEALALVDRWLLDPKSVSREELDAAAEAARAAEAAWAAAEAARAAEAAWAAAEAARAAGAAAEAARAARAAAWAARATGAAARAAAYKKQGEFIIEHLRRS